MSDRSDPSIGRVTLNDVAERSGVSSAAASLALRGLPGVATETRSRVISAAASLGYRTRAPNDRPTRTTIGLLMKARAHEMDETNAFYGPVIAGISSAGARHGLDVRLDALMVDEHFHPIEVPRLVTSPDIDGLLVLGAYLSDASATMIGTRPMVLVDGYSETPGRFATVVTDNVRGASQATRHLLALGHRRIALVGTTSDAFPSILERRQGYLAAMAEAELDPLFVDGHHDECEGIAGDVRAALARWPDVTGLVAANDEIALALLGEIGVAVPEEVSIVGFDDIEASSLVRPRLDTVSVDKPAMGRLAVSLLLHLMEHPDDPPFVATQPARLVVRASTAAPAHRRVGKNEIDRRSPSSAAAASIGPTRRGR